MRQQGGGLMFVALVLMLLTAFILFQDHSDSFVSVAPAQNALAAAVAAAPTTVPPLPEDAAAIRAPYDQFTVTQGLHGDWYGHNAIDLAAGAGATILSPISGTVTALYVDVWGNPTLVIENEVYQVTLLHGDYTVGVGQQVRMGDPLGTEGNNGYTTDLQGNPCMGRGCGYHSHLNIFDKRIGVNANPFVVLGLQQNR